MLVCMRAKVVRGSRTEVQPNHASGTVSLEACVDSAINRIRGTIIRIPIIIIIVYGKSVGNEVLRVTYAHGVRRQRMEET